MSNRPAVFALIYLLLTVGCEQNKPEAASEVPAAAGSLPARPAARTGRFENGKIVTDTFDVRHHLSGDELTLVLDTDLPDATELMVGVHRIYKQRGSSNSYVNDYYSQKSSVGAWRRPREISLDAERWRRGLDEKRRMMAAAGEPFEVSEIADEVVVSLVVPVNQDDPRFGKWNKNLVGSVVEESTSGLQMRNVRAEIEIPYPLTGEALTTRWADPRGLQPKRTYIVERQTPLVPEFDPPDPLAAIEQIVDMPSGSRISIREVRSRGSEPWYRVEATSGLGEALGSGWVNSTALIGQNIRKAN